MKLQIQIKLVYYKILLRKTQNISKTLFKIYFYINIKVNNLYFEKLREKKLVEMLKLLQKFSKMFKVKLNLYQIK